MDIKVSGRKVTVTDALRSYVDEKIGGALEVFDIQPMTCDVVLRVESADPDMYAAIDIASDKVTRQLRKFKTRVIDRRQRTQGLPVAPTSADLADLIDAPEEDDELVREKVIDLPPMTEEEALVQTDLIGHDFYVFTNATTGLVNVIYRRKNGGYGIIKPKIEEPDD